MQCIKFNDMWIFSCDVYSYFAQRYISIFYMQRKQKIFKLLKNIVATIFLRVSERIVGLKGETKGRERERQREKSTRQFNVEEKRNSHKQLIHSKQKEQNN